MLYTYIYYILLVQDMTQKLIIYDVTALSPVEMALRCSSTRARGGVRGVLPGPGASESAAGLRLMARHRALGAGAVLDRWAIRLACFEPS